MNVFSPAVPAEAAAPGRAVGAACKTLSAFVCVGAGIFVSSARASVLSPERRLLTTLQKCGVEGEYTPSSFAPNLPGYYKITNLPKLRCPSDRWTLLFDDAGYAALRSLWLQGVPVAFDLTGKLRGQYFYRALNHPIPSRWPDVKDTVIVLGPAADLGLLVQLNQMYQDVAARMPHQVYDRLWPLLRKRQPVEILVDFVLLTRAFAAAMTERNKPDYLLVSLRQGIVRAPSFFKSMQRKFNYSQATTDYHQNIGHFAAFVLDELRKTNPAKHKQITEILSEFMTVEHLAVVGKWKYLGRIAKDIACVKALAQLL